MLTGQQATMWKFVDQLLVKYGPLALMLLATCYYIVTKDDVIEKKDAQILKQQETMLEVTKASTDSLVRTSTAQVELARSVDDNTKTMARLVTLMERQGPQMR
jgi:hypothetical protein